MKSGSILAFTDLGCSKGGRQLFKGVHCTVPAGRWLHVAGANGIGKTSLLRLLGVDLALTEVGGQLNCGGAAELVY